MAQFIISAVLAVIILAMALKTVREDERLAIFRLGHFFRVAGPGLVLLIPIADRGVKVNLGPNIPGWQGLSKADLEEKIKTFVSGKP
jgi:regulator of protease activity HflC (stomatin/prohibitin superfamily)